MDVPREWRVRLRIVPRDLDVIVIVVKDREEVTVEFDQQRNSRESSRRERRADLWCSFCRRTGHIPHLCPCQLRSRDSTHADAVDLGLRVGPSSPNLRRHPELNICNGCGLSGLPRNHQEDFRLRVMGLLGEDVMNEMMDLSHPFMLPMVDYIRMELILFILY
ncbi:hypothetical protein R1sor_004257 [Riccia sorocarpa]|uniref:Uncharacterized protein n=1 Tax=Riccia sorocarpa TaxID=122646 RepID=A0ABD3H404_9MARC